MKFNYVFNFHRIISQTKSTQILYGIIGSIYGASKVIEYYPQKITELIVDEYNLCLDDAKNNRINKYKKEIIEYKKIVEDTNDELKKRENYSLLGKILLLGETCMIAIRSTIAENQIDENENLINMINNKEYIRVKKVEKPLFLINNNNLSTNVALSSMFYGTLFAAVGTLPIISFISLSSYAIYNNFYSNKSDSDNKLDSDNKSN